MQFFKSANRSTEFNKNELETMRIFGDHVREFSIRKGMQ